MKEQTYQLPIEAKERGERLRRLRNLANLSRKDLCSETNININTYIGYEVGRYGGLTKKGAEKVIDYLIIKGVYCTLEWLMYGLGKTPSVITDIKVNSHDLEMNEDQKINEELHLFNIHYSNTINYQITDDGMLPIYEIGSYVAGICYYESDIQNLIGNNCIIKTKSGEIFVRNLNEGRSKDTYILTCINPTTLISKPVLYDVKLVLAAKIIWHRKIAKQMENVS